MIYELLVHHFCWVFGGYSWDSDKISSKILIIDLSNFPKPKSKSFCHHWLLWYKRQDLSSFSQNLTSKTNNQQSKRKEKRRMQTLRLDGFGFFDYYLRWRECNPTSQEIKHNQQRQHGYETHNECYPISFHHLLILISQQSSLLSLLRNLEGVSLHYWTGSSQIRT